MILTSWKEIASHLSCTVRTAQRWEQGGLPVKRPYPGRRSWVVADSEMLDSWLRDISLVRRRFARLSNVRRARELRSEMRLSRQMLREKMALLKSNSELLRENAKVLRSYSHNAPRVHPRILP